MSVAQVQEIVAEKFGVEVMEDWMFDTSEDFQAKNGVELENEIKGHLAEQFPEDANSDLLKVE